MMQIEWRRGNFLNIYIYIYIYIYIQQLKSQKLDVLE